MMTLTNVSIRDLVRIAFDIPIEYITGESLSNTIVKWVVTGIDDVNPGDFLILKSTENPPHPYPDIISSAHERGAVGIMIVGQKPNILQGFEEKIPILVISETDDLRAVQHKLLTVLISQRAALTERGARVYAQLSHIAADGGGLKGLIKAIIEISGRGVLLLDKRGRILAEGSSPGLHAIWDDVLSQLSSLDSLPPRLRDRKRTGFQAQSFLQEIPGGLERLMRPIVVSEIARGYLSLVAPCDELDALDHVIIEQGCMVAALEMSRDKAIREAEKRLKGDLLTALLHEDLVPRDARLWAQSMGMDLNQKHAALRIAWDAPETPSRRRLETLVSGEVSRLGINVIVNPMSSEVICICQVASDVDRPEIIIKLGQAILDQGREEYPIIPMRCGVGTPADDLTNWRDSFRQAGQALEMARRLGENKPLYFPDLSVYRLLMQIEHNPELMNFQEQTIGTLIAHEGSSDLIQTLEAYFENKSNLSQTAEALYIHRNTLLYRMERIQEILKLDLDRPASRLAVQLAMHIYRMMGGESSSS